MATLEIWTQGGRDPNPANKFDKIEKYSAINALGAIIPDKMHYEKSGLYEPYTQSGVVNFTIPGLIIDGVGQTLKFISDGSSNINFDVNFDTTAMYNITSGSSLAAGTYWFYMFALNGKVQINVKQATT